MDARARIMMYQSMHNRRVVCVNICIQNGRQRCTSPTNVCMRTLCILSRVVLEGDPQKMYEPRLKWTKTKSSLVGRKDNKIILATTRSTLVLASTRVWILIEVMPKPKPNNMSVKMREPKKRPLSRCQHFYRTVSYVSSGRVNQPRHVAGECDGKSAMTPVCESIQKIRIKSRIIVFVQVSQESSFIILVVAMYTL